MKKIVPKIKFIYSLPYDELLTHCANKVFKRTQEREIRQFIKKLQSKWNKVKSSVLQELEYLTKNKWRKQEIECYLVKYCKYSGLSAPLTIRYETDIDYAIDTLIHELVHIIISDDFEKYKKIERKLKNQFPKENPRILLHIYIVYIEFQVLKKVFTSSFIEKIITWRQKFKLGRSWEVVISQKKKLKELFRL